MPEENSPNRHPGDVCSEILAIVPEDQHEFRHRLEHIRSSASFRPPELQCITWSELNELLEEYCQIPLTEDWQIKTIAIYTVKSEEEVCDLYGAKVH